MAKTFRIYLDLDDVLVDFTRRACEVHGVCKDTQLDPIRNGSWDLVPIIQEIRGEPFTEEDFWEGIHAAGSDFWRSLPTLPWAMELIEMVRDYTRDWFILSSPSRCPSSWYGKRQWVIDVLGYNYNRLILTNDKTSCAVPDSILIDDSERNCGAFVGTRSHYVLFPSSGSRVGVVDDPIKHVRDRLERILSKHAR